MKKGTLLKLQYNLIATKGVFMFTSIVKLNGSHPAKNQCAVAQTCG